MKPKDPTSNYQVYRVTMDVTIPNYQADNADVPSITDYITVDSEATLLGWHEERLKVTR